MFKTKIDYDIILEMRMVLSSLSKKEKTEEKITPNEKKMKVDKKNLRSV